MPSYNESDPIFPFKVRRLEKINMNANVSEREDYFVVFSARRKKLWMHSYMHKHIRTNIQIHELFVRACLCMCVYRYNFSDTFIYSHYTHAYTHIHTFLEWANEGGDDFAVKKRSSQD